STNNRAGFGSRTLGGGGAQTDSASGGSALMLGVVANFTTTNVLSCPTCVIGAYNHSGALFGTAHSVVDSCVLGTSCSVTLTGAAIFTSATSYTCVCQDDTAIDACNVAQSSGSAFAITGNSTDTIRYVCVGN